jgi:tetratricopeptide (TPR) repeat protein
MEGVTGIDRGAYVMAHPCRLFSTEILAALASLLFATGANAQNPPWDGKANRGLYFEYDEAAVAKLPPYCRNSKYFNTAVPGRNNAAEIERWHKVMGPGFVHIHHYCHGLQLTHRARYESRTKEARNRELGFSLGEFDFVIARVDSTFALLPEILTNKGENLLLLERDREAIAALVRAIEVRGDYWPPYAALGDYYKKMGKLDEARNWLKRGLAASGGAKALERRLRELPPN